MYSHSQAAFVYSLAGSENTLCTSSLLSPYWFHCISLFAYPLCDLPHTALSCFCSVRLTVQALSCTVRSLVAARRHPAVASLRRWSMKTLSETSSVMIISADMDVCVEYVLEGFKRASRNRACTEPHTCSCLILTVQTALITESPFM